MVAPVVLISSGESRPPATSADACLPVGRREVVAVAGPEGADDAGLVVGAAGGVEDVVLGARARVEAGVPQLDVAGGVVGRDRVGGVDPVALARGGDLEAEGCLDGRLVEGRLAAVAAAGPDDDVGRPRLEDARRPAR